MVTHKVALIPGDGIGPEVTSLTLKVLEAAEVPIEFEVFELGEPAIKKYNDPAPAELLQELKKYNVMLKGPLTTPIGTGYRSVNVTLRKYFDTYAVVRPAKSLPVSWLYHDVPRYSNIDIVLVREATEEFYAGIEHDILAAGERVASETIGVVTRKGSERVIRFAFEYARKNKRKKVTVVTKANVLKLTGGLFLEVFREVAKDYPELEKEEMLVDNMAMQLVLRPKDYDVIVTTNLMGDILSDLISGLIGGLGVAPSSNIGDKYAIFEPVHGSAPKYTNQWKVNPTAEMLTATSMLRYIGLNEKAELIEKAIFKTLEEKKVLTYDMVRILRNAGIADIKESSNKEFTEEIIRNLKALM
jgi:isocitrate dehydrogenase (NAD+)